METTATGFRRNLFQLMERAMDGESIEIAFRGTRLRLTPQSGGSKLSRVVRRGALRADPASIAKSDPRLMAELGRKWKRDDGAL